LDSAEGNRPEAAAGDERETRGTSVQVETEGDLRLLLQSEQAAHTRMQAAETMFRSLLESAPDGIVIVDPTGCIMLVNSQAEQMFGYPREELLGQAVELLLPERFRESHSEHRLRYHSEPRTRPMGVGLELSGRRKDGTEFPVEISLSPLETPEGRLVTSIIRDVTDRKLAEQERLELLSRERERSEQLKLAIREAHHRIKNNLQAVSDLLYLAFTAEDNANPAEALRESMERIQAIALVHDLLSQEQDVETVDAQAMIQRLVPMVLHSGGIGPDAVQLDVNVSPVPLPSKIGTTLALILNELVSNAVKHALVHRTGGTLRVWLTRGEEELHVGVRDDGPGLPSDFDLDTDANVGFQVVRTLAERDLGGRLILTSDGGLTAEVSFPR
jgi:PAS domain S-box-containing protein